jgi:hypothetical protein
MEIKLEDIKQWLEQKKLWNNTPLDQIEFTFNGKKFIPQLYVTDEDGEPTELTIEEFMFMGLANTTYFEMFADGEIK